ncbi:MAG: hypothetical protein LBL91_04355 [Lachnospiraceae bacterium]|jgi:hypothetical protein|nr:hypothetical protein [Lachnospiraceae bacterium]
MQNQQEKAKEYNEKIKAISKQLGLPEKDVMLSIEYKDDIMLNSQIKQPKVFVIKVKAEDGKIYHVVADTNFMKLAQIDEKGVVTLSDELKQKFEKYLKTDEKFILKEYKTDEKTIDDAEKQNIDKDDADKENVGVGVPDDPSKTTDKQMSDSNPQKLDKAIKSIILVRNKEEYERAIDKKLDENVYIVTYANNKTTVMTGDLENGKLKEMAGIETSDFNTKLLDELNMDKSSGYYQMDSEDIKTITDERNPKYDYVIVRNSDSPEKSVVITETPSNDVDMYYYDENEDNINQIELEEKYKIDEKELERIRAEKRELEARESELENEKENAESEEEIIEIEEEQEEIEIREEEIEDEEQWLYGQRRGH